MKFAIYNATLGKHFEFPGIAGGVGSYMLIGTRMIPISPKTLMHTMTFLQFHNRCVMQEWHYNIDNQRYWENHT